MKKYTFARSLVISATLVALLPACLSLGCSAALDEQGLPVEEQIGEASQAAVFGADNRVPADAAFFTANPWLRASGLVSAGGLCSGTRVDGNYVLTAAHCFALNQDPATVRFFPGFLHEAADPNNDNKARINVTRIIRGTGSQYVAGSDWALLVVDPSTYFAGSNGLATWDAYPSMTLSELTSAPNNTTVSSFGYSSDLIDNIGADYGSFHQNCSLKKDDPAYKGVYFSDCDFRKGASGGPIFSGTGATALLLGVNGGEQVGANNVVYSDGTANRVTSTKALVWAPWDPGGIAVSKDSSGKIHVFASDRASLNQLNYRRQIPGSSDFQRWQDFRGATGVPSPTRMSATLADNHQFVFASTQAGRVYARWETAASGSWSNWTDFFGADSQTTNVVDVATTTPGGATLMAFLMRSNGTVYARTKSGGWAGAWGAWASLGASLPAGVTARALAAGQTGGYPILVMATSNDVKIRWATDTAGVGWSAWDGFADGLQAGVVPLDVKVGLDTSGRLDVFLLARHVSGGLDFGPVIYRRTKTSPLPGSSWGSWQTYRASWSYPELKKATALGLRPVSGLEGDGLLVISDANTLASTYDANGNFSGFRPFYGPEL